jgi:hypothetical protein
MTVANLIRKAGLGVFSRETPLSGFPLALMKSQSGLEKEGKG